MNTVNECIINGVQYRCRTCFDPGTQVCYLSDKCSSSKTWWNLLNDVVQLKSNDEELLPTTICCKCVDKLSSYYNFQLQIQNVNNQYSQLLTNRNKAVEENVDHSSECMAESAISLKLEECVTEIKFEDECIVPCDIAVGSANLEQEWNEFQSEDSNDPFQGIYNENLTLSCEGQQSNTSLTEEMNDAYETDINENSSTTSEESEYLPEKEKEDEINKNMLSSQEAKKQIRGMFECNTCQSLHSTLSRLRQHIRTVHSSEGEEDPLSISKSFEKKIMKKYPNWFNIEKIGKRFICSLCKKSFSLSRTCRRHIIKMHCSKRNLFPCGLCDYCGNCKEYLYAHIKRIHPKETFDSNTKRIIYRFGEHIYGKPAPWRLVECKLCNTVFETTKELRQHLPSHCDITTLDGLQLNSSIVQRWFPEMDLTSVKEIISMDVGEKEWFRYYTVLNEFSFELSISDTEVEDLEDTIAKGSNKYNCEVCGKDFSFKYQLFAHLKEEHFREETPFKCRRCKLEFVSHNMYEQHIKIHCRNECKTFQCSYCPAKFVYEDYLQNHKCVTQIPHSDSDSEIDSEIDTEINKEQQDAVIGPEKSKIQNQFKNSNDATSLSNRTKFQNQNPELSKQLPLTHVRDENHEQWMFSGADNSKSSNCIQPLSGNIIRCGFCALSFKSLRDLRQHMPIHADGKTLIDFNACYYVKQFENSKITDYEELQQRIRNAYIKRQISCFYLAIDKYGNELDISDSDSNTEDVDETPVMYIYMCELCKETFAQRKHLLQHQKQRHQEGPMPFTCQQCKLQYVSIYLLQQHLKRDCWNEHRLNAEQCTYCKARFIWPYNMLQHKKIQHRVTAELPTSLLHPTKTRISNEANMQYCYLCPEKFLTTNELNDHLGRHRLKPSTIKTIESIQLSTLWPNGNKIINCKTCNLQFTSMTKLKEHFLPNNSSSQCSGPHSSTNYSVINEKGFELHLELDSETESESDTETIRDDENLRTLQPYKCQVCSKSFKRKYQIAQHQRSMHNYEDLNLKCACCVFKTVSQKVLDYHRATQCFNGEKKHFCRQCNFRFMWKENLANHISIIHIPPKKNQPHKKRVKINGTESKTEQNTDASLQHKGNTPFKCKFCEMTFTRKVDLIEHTRKHTNEQQFKCTICDKSFTRKQHLCNHIRLHNNERPYKCNLCSKAYVKLVQLKYHLQSSHTTVKAHKCNICSKSYRTKADLVRHCKTKGHNELFWTPEINTDANQPKPQTILPPPPQTQSEKPKQLCPICGIYISATSSLNFHMKSHTDEKPHKCDICGKGYLLKHDAVVHRCTHFADRPFKCKQCNKSFVTKYNLKCHVRQHTGERPYECNVCNKKFNFIKYLKLHLLKHTGETPFICPTCGQEFTCKAYLKRHIEKHELKMKTIKGKNSAEEEILI